MWLTHLFNQDFLGESPPKYIYQFYEVEAEMDSRYKEDECSWEYGPHDSAPVPHRKLFSVSETCHDSVGKFPFYAHHLHFPQDPEREERQWEGGDKKNKLNKELVYKWSCCWVGMCSG